MGEVVTLSRSRGRQQLTPGAELRMLHSIAGHFGFEQSYLGEVDAALTERLTISV